MQRDLFKRSEILFFFKIKLKNHVSFANHLTGQLILQLWSFNFQMFRSTSIGGSNLSHARFGLQIDKDAWQKHRSREIHIYKEHTMLLLFVGRQIEKLN